MIQYFRRQHDTRKQFQLILFHKAKVGIPMDIGKLIPTDFLLPQIFIIDFKISSNLF